MNWLISKGRVGKQISIKNLLSILMVGTFIVIGIGVSGIWANEDNTENNFDEDSFSYQNAAQAQHAHNVAIQATLQDPEVAKAFARARASKDPQDIQDAKELFHDKLEDFSKQISDMRSSGMGWGNIAKHLDVHPSFLGRGHSKFFGKHNFSYSKHSHMRSEIKAATARSYKGEDAKGHYGHGAVSKGKSFGLSRAKGLGHSKGRGLALGHSKGKGGATLAGHNTGHGNGHGNGHGGGHGNGNGGGNGNGNGGGNGNGNGGGNGNGNGK
jgi:hypothetical protein